MSSNAILRKAKYALRFIPIKRIFRFTIFFILNVCKFEKYKNTYEQLNWIKLHDRNLVYTWIVDKYEAKEYGSAQIGDEYMIPTLGVWNHFNEIDFE